MSPAGRPEVGPPINVRLGELLPEVDGYAAAEGIKRAEAIRRLVRRGLLAETATTKPRNRIG